MSVLMFILMVISFYLAGLNVIRAAPYFASPYVLTSPIPYMQISENTQNTGSNTYKAQNSQSDIASISRSGNGNNNSGNQKMKKSAAYDFQNTLFVPESEKRIQTYPSEFYNTIDDFSAYNPPGPGVLTFPQSNGQYPKSLGQTAKTPEKSFPPTASSKIFIPDHHHPPHHHEPLSHFFHHDKPHILHENVDLLTGVAGHKLKHAGEVLESGVLTEPIVHKLPFIKAALLQLLAIIGPLSAAKTIHVVAQASHSSNPHEHHNEIPPPSGPSAPGPEVIPGDPLHGPPAPHHPPTLVGLILNFMGQLSRFNTEAKLHLIPNLLKIISTTSTSSAHSSAHY